MTTWELRWTSERSVWAQMPDSVSDLRVPSQLAAWLTSSHAECIRAAVPSSRGVLIEFELHQSGTKDLWADAVELIGSFDREGIACTSAIDSSDRGIRIPVCYDQRLAPDLMEVAQRLKCHQEQIIEHHSAVSYTVSAMGFTPGFGYLSGLHQSLRLPRMETPRVRVPAGSVAIAEDMTAVYPFQSAGGWHLIGRTPRQLFNPNLNNPSIMSVGDTVSFERLSYEEYTEYEHSLKRVNR